MKKSGRVVGDIVYGANLGTINPNSNLVLRNRRSTKRTKVVVDDISHSLAGYKGRKR